MIFRVTESADLPWLPGVLALFAVAAAVRNAAVSHWVGVLVALTALFPTLLWWQLRHYLPHPERRSLIRPVLVVTAVSLIVIAAVTA
jgi:hypothetical protein